jgi:hypothetical protein
VRLSWRTGGTTADHGGDRGTAAGGEPARGARGAGCAYAGRSVPPRARGRRDGRPETDTRHLAAALTDAQQRAQAATGELERLRDEVRQLTTDKQARARFRLFSLAAVADRGARQTLRAEAQRQVDQLTSALADARTAATRQQEQYRELQLREASHVCGPWRTHTRTHTHTYIHT